MESNFTDNYIKEKTIQYTKDAIEENKIVATSDLDQDGELDTPNSFENDMMEVWTLDFDLTEERINEIQAIVTDAILSVLPEDLKEYY